MYNGSSTRYIGSTNHNDSKDTMTKTPARSLSAMERYQRAQLLITQAAVVKNMAVAGVNWYRRYTAVPAPVRHVWPVVVRDNSKIYEMLQAVMVATVDPNLKYPMDVDTTVSWDPETDEHTEKLVTTFEGRYVSSLQIGEYTIDVRHTTEKLEMEDDDSSESGALASWEKELVNSMFGSMDQPDGKRKGGSGEESHDPEAMGFRESKIVFECESLDERAAVIKYIEDLALSQSRRGKRKQTNRIFIGGGTGYWQAKGSIGSRPVDSVVLQSGVMERIEADTATFTKSKQRYQELGIPWHRGYLFEGPPGTGKTSLAKAVATMLHCDIYIAQLSAMASDNDLTSLMVNLEADRSVLLLEDIDIVSASHSRTDDRKGVTMNGLLQALDGVTTPEGVLIILSTNDRAILDPALTRPGRVDMELHIGYVTDEQLANMVTRFHGSNLDLPKITGDITPAEIVGVFKDHADDETVQTELTRIINHKNGLTS